MSEFLMADARERKMEIEIYGKTLKLVVLEPTRKELVMEPLKLQKLSPAKQADAVYKTGLRHIIRVDGLGYGGKELVTDPARKDYNPDWKKLIGQTSVGMKVGGLVAGELYQLGEKNRQETDDLDELDDLDEETAAQGEAQAAGKTAAK